MVACAAWFIGGVFVILSVPISVYEVRAVHGDDRCARSEDPVPSNPSISAMKVAMHTEHYTQPRLQRHVIRILWMVPIYGVDAWLALRFRNARAYLDPLRECYEAYGEDPPRAKQQLLQGEGREGRGGVPLLFLTLEL